MTTFGDKIITHNKGLSYKGKLPSGFDVLNPFHDNPETMRVMKAFYDTYYNDNHSRKFIMAINPGRLGAGTTGVPFTDTKRLESHCGITMESAKTYEVSATFVYRMIEEFGGVEAFYSQFYINNAFPFALIRKNKKGNWVNANYYDDKTLFAAVKATMVENIKRNISLGIDTSEVFVMGKKNADFIKRLNKEHHFFEKLTVLEHPRYIQQYKLKDLDFYLTKYLHAFCG